MSPEKPETTEPYLRFKNRTDVIKTLESLEHDLHRLNEKFYNKPSLNGAVLFAVDQSDSTLAGAIVSADAPNINPNRLRFKQDTIDNRYVVLGSTALGEALKADGPTYLKSKMNPTEHSVYTIPLASEESPLGAIQFAIDLTDKHRLKENSFEGFATGQQETIQQISDKVAWLSGLTPSLPRSLATKSSITPNAYGARWDVNRSTYYMQDSELEADFEDYLNALKLSIAEILSSDAIVDTFGPVLIGQGDGQNIIFRFPEYITEGASDKAFVDLMRTVQIDPIIAMIKAKQAEINNAFPFDPTISITADAGFIRFDSLGDANGKIFWNLANKTKK